MRKFIWPIVIVVLIALLAGGGIYLSGQGGGDSSGTKNGTLLDEAASTALVGRTSDVRVPWGRLQVTVTEPLEQTQEGVAAPENGRVIGVQARLGGTEDLLVTNQIPDGELMDPVFTLVVDGEEHILEGMVGWIAGDEVQLVARRQYVALTSVPEQVDLRVEYDGVEQEVAGASGEVDRAGAVGLYDLDFGGGAVACADPLWSTGAADVGENVTQCLVTSSATRPYVAGLGWAPEGSKWMVVTVLPGAPAEFDGPLGTYEVTDTSVSYLLDGRAPKEFFAQSEILPTDVEEDPADPQVVIFEVPVDRSPGTFEVRIRVTGEIEVEKRKTTQTKTYQALVAQGAFV